MVSMLLRGLDGSYISRLLNTAENGITTETVASSWIDALGGLELL
jgi:hypothetical protein